MGENIDFVRFKAQRYHIEGLVDRGDGDTIFSQMLRNLKRDHGNYENNFRRDSLETRVWKANFLHEGSIDDGGPYRESMENISYELTSGVLPLLVKTPNQISKSGLRQECFVFNPLARSEKELEMFRFFGILMGFAVRSEQTFNIDLHPSIWKKIFISDSYIHHIPLMNNFALEVAFENFLLLMLFLTCRQN